MIYIQTMNTHCEKMSELIMELMEKEPVCVVKYITQEMMDIINYYQSDEYEIKKLVAEYNTANDDRKEEIRHDLALRDMLHLIL